MKRDRAQLIQAIEAIKAKLAQMEEELNKHDEFKHFPSKGDEYYYYTSIGTLCSNTAGDDELRVSAYKTEEDAQKAYNKAVATEKIKRKILKLQGDWEPDWKYGEEAKVHINYHHYSDMFMPEETHYTQNLVDFPYMKDKDVANTIINEFNNELKLVFEIK